MLMRLASLLKSRADMVTLGAQGLIVDDASRILLIRHGYRPGWHFPGGGVERGEEIEDALAREILEETGVILTQPGKLVGIYSHFAEYPGDHIVLFLVEHWRRDTVPRPNPEIAEQRFFARDEIPENLAPGAHRRLREIFDGVEQSSVW